jgi:hypothetical protein
MPSSGPNQADQDLKTFLSATSQALGINPRGQVGFLHQCCGRKPRLWRTGNDELNDLSRRVSPTVWFPLRTSTRPDRSLKGSRKAPQDAGLRRDTDSVAADRGFQIADFELQIFNWQFRFSI